MSPFKEEFSSSLGRQRVARRRCRNGSEASPKAPVMRLDAGDVVPGSLLKLCANHPGPQVAGGGPPACARSFPLGSPSSLLSPCRTLVHTTGQRVHTYTPPAEMQTPTGFWPSLRSCCHRQGALRAVNDSPSLRASPGDVLVRQASLVLFACKLLIGCWEQVPGEDPEEGREVSGG